MKQGMPGHSQLRYCGSSWLCTAGEKAAAPERSMSSRITRGGVAEEGRRDASGCPAALKLA